MKDLKFLETEYIRSKDDAKFMLDMIDKIRRRENVMVSNNLLFCGRTNDDISMLVFASSRFVII